MGRLLSGGAPLRGRAALELIVPTFDYRLAATFWQIADPRTAVLANAVVGTDELHDVAARSSGIDLVGLDRLYHGA